MTRSAKATRSAPNDMNALENAGVAGVLLVLGTVLKTVTPIDNRWIPVVLLVVGTFLQMLALNAGWADVNAWISAFLYAAAPTGLYEAARNAKENLAGD